MRQRRFSSEDLIRLRDQGLTTQQIADQLQVSRQAVEKRSKRLAPPELLALSPHQQIFAQALASGASKKAAAEIAFNTSSPESARTLGSKTAALEPVREAVEALMQRYNVGRERRVQRLGEIVNGPDLTLACRGLDMAFRVSGEYLADKVQEQPTIALVDLSKYRMHSSEEKPPIDITPSKDDET